MNVKKFLALDKERDRAAYRAFGMLRALVRLEFVTDEHAVKAVRDLDHITALMDESLVDEEAA